LLAHGSPFVVVILLNVNEAIPDRFA
jgi:hypothetical protein